MTPKEQITEIVHQMFKDHVCGQPIPLPRHISAKIEPAISSALESRERALAKKMIEAIRGEHLEGFGSKDRTDADAAFDNALCHAEGAVKDLCQREGITID